VKALPASLTLLLAAAACSAPPPSLRRCDVRQRDCQLDVFKALHELRGQLWDPWTTAPRVLVLTPEQYRQLSAIELGPPRSSGSEWTPDLDATQADHRWFNENTVAAYWSGRKLVTLVDNQSSTFDSAEEVSLLVHEYLHAAQDREFGLRPWGRLLTTDEEMVRMALLEGEARLFQTLARLTLTNVEATAAAIGDQLQRELTSVRQQSQSAPALHPHVRRRLPYPIGGRFFTDAWKRGGSPGVNRVFVEPPASFAELMLASEGLPAPAARSPELCDPSFADGNTRWLDRDTLGAGLLYATLLALSGKEEESWEASLTWRKDFMWIYEHPVHGTVRLWRVHAPGLGGSRLGAFLSGRTTPPRLEGEDLLYWAPDLPDFAEALRNSQRCR
jgi:hypothetical protein